jgi:hypothetical protein
MQSGFITNKGPFRHRAAIHFVDSLHPGKYPPTWFCQVFITHSAVPFMDRPLRQFIQTRLSPGRITGVYVITGGLWIILSSFWASTHTAAHEHFLHLEIVKGLSFVAFTSVLLWFLCRSWSRQIRNVCDEFTHLDLGH